MDILTYSINISINPLTKEAIIGTIASNSGSSIMITLSTLSTSNIHHLPETYKSRPSYPHLKEWVYGNISSYNFSEMKIRACLDFVKVRFSTSKPYMYSHIKKFMTEKTGELHHIKPVGLSSFEAKTQCASEFDITIQDMKSYKSLYKRLELLRHFNPKIDLNSLQIIQIEVALDFYNAEPTLLIALLKWLRLKQEQTTNVRFFGSTKESVKFLEVYDGRKTKNFMPPTFSHVYDFLMHGGCSNGSNGNFAINDISAAVYYHGYLKTTDRGRPLPRDQWCVRLEVRLQGDELNGIILENINLAIRSAAKYLSFTCFKPYNTIPSKQLANCIRVKPLGLENPKNKTRNNLPPFVTSFSKLNSIKMDAFRDLIKAFRIPKSGETLPPRLC